MSTSTKSSKSSKSHSHSHKLSSSTSSSSSSSSSSEKQYYLITNTPVRAPTEAVEIDLQAESWKLPYSIDDEDLTFDGKPLNMLYEENKWQAEHHDYGHVDYSSSGSSSGDYQKSSHRGRSRQSKK